MAEAPTRMQRKKALVRAAIVDAALQLFASKGIAATTIAEIMAAAGHGVGTFYNYFTGKEDLARTALGEKVAEAHERFGSAVAAAPDTPARIRAVILTAGAVVGENRLLFDVYYEAQRAGRPEAMGDHGPAFVGLLEEIIAEGQRSGELRADIPPEVIAETCQALLQSSAMSPLRLDFLECLRHKVDLLVDGLAPRA